MAPIPLTLLIRDFALFKRSPVAAASALYQGRSSIASIPSLTKRQNSVILPTTYQGVGSDLPTSTVVAIVLGVVLGSLALILLVWWALWQNSGAESSPSEIIEVRDRRSLSPPRRRHSHRRNPELVEIRRVDRSRSPRRSAGRIIDERIIEERIPRTRSIGGRSFREEVIIEPSRPRSRRRSEEEVIVYDDESISTPPRRASYRRGEEREYGRRSRR
jgi:hypothetical protein